MSLYLKSITRFILLQHALLLLGGSILVAGNLSRNSVSTSTSTSNTSTSTSTSTSSTGTSNSGTTAEQLAQMRTVTQGNLSRAKIRIQAALNAQAAARTAALTATSSVPNGISSTGIGGLVPNVGISTSLSTVTVPSSVKSTVSSAIAAGTVTTSATVTITYPTGTTVTVAAGAALPDVPAGSTLVFSSSAGTLTASSGSTFSMILPTGTAYATTASDGSTTWKNIGSLTQTYSSATSTYTVTAYQTSEEAVLYWNKYNIGKNTTLYYDQTLGGNNVANWIAFNIVNDASGNPSSILGKIQAAGQVYIINQNGIVFYGSSQVNVHGLVASSLPINTTLLNQGLLNNPDLQYLFSSLTISAITGGTMAEFDPGTKPTQAEGTTNDVVVKKGAILSATPTVYTSTTESTSSKSYQLSYVVASSSSIALSYTNTSSGSQTLIAGSDYTLATSTTSGKTTITLTTEGISKIGSSEVAVTYTPEEDGGKIALIGPNVTNEGTISTPKGQTILAAGLQVGFYEHDTSDASLRGLDVYIGQVDSTSGTVTNNGIVEIGEGSALLTGATINQLGVIVGTTSVSLNARVDLLAQYNSVVRSDATGFVITPATTGKVTLGSDSLVAILPDWSSTDTVVGTELALSSIINIKGKNIEMEQDSEIFAPSATVTLSAGTWIPLGNTYTFQSTNATGTNAQTVVLDSGAVIDVSGSQDVEASVTDNVIAVELLSTQLADYPLQKDGVLYGKTIYVDIRDTGTNSDGTTWVGTALADTSGYVSLIKRTVGELTVNGGSVSITAGSSVTLNSGSSINVSGGWINYDGGVVKTTKVVSNGVTYDISRASADLVYSSVEDASGGYEEGYIQGANAGSVSITAPSMTLSGDLNGKRAVGQRQRYLSAADTAGTTIPDAGTLTLSFTTYDSTTNYQMGSAQNIYFESDSSVTPSDATLILSTDLASTHGFGNFYIDNGIGKIVVDSGAELSVAAGSSVTMKAADIDIKGTVTDPAGTLSFTVYAYSPYAYDTSNLLSTPNAVTGWGSFTLSGTLDASGLLVNDKVDSTETIATKGGNVTITGYNIDLQKGSVINVNGGVYMNSAGAFKYGNGGSVAITGGQDSMISSLLGGTVTLGGTLTGYGTNSNGGSLSIQALLIRVGEQTSSNALCLSNDFFNEGGFSHFTLIGLGDPNDTTTPAIYIASDASINPQVKSLGVTLSGTDIILTPTLSSQVLRDAATLTFKAPGVKDSYTSQWILTGDIFMAEGATITASPTSKGTSAVTLSGGTVAVMGKIAAPGGSITIKGADSYRSNSLYTYALPTVDLGSNSYLSTAGTVLLTQNVYGYRSGSVLDGGSINVSGNIVAEKGSVLDVSGTSGTLDLTATERGVKTYGLTRSGARIATVIDSDGGSIDLNGTQELFVASTLLGNAGGNSADGGTLTVSSGRFYSAGTYATATDVVLIVSQTNSNLMTDYYGTNSSAIGHQVKDAAGNAVSGLGYFAADTFLSGGFDSLALESSGGAIQFNGAVNISARGSIIVGTGGVISTSSPVTLSASYIALGSVFEGPLTTTSLATSIYTDEQTGDSIYYAPTTGTGNLTLSASLIDVGNLLLQGIGNLNLIADGASSSVAGGDIRGDGTVDILGNVYMRAGQIYPITGCVFTIAAYGSNNTVTIERSSNVYSSLPLSGGGTINIYASNINQNGALVAPLGIINLGWDGTSTSTFSDRISGSLMTLPTTSTLSLGAKSYTSVSAVDPTTGVALSIPYGTIKNGDKWIDPSGTDITASGVPQKAINLSAVAIDDQKGSIINVNGGGKLYAYEFISGTGGTVDILASTNSYAIIPGYSSSFAPVDLTVDSDGKRVYTNSGLLVGERIYLSASSGVPAGYYTLLPARYALLSGAYLVTAQSGANTETSLSTSEGASVVPGYIYNSLNGTKKVSAIYSLFEVASSTVLSKRADYEIYSGNTFLAEGATDNDQTVPRLGLDAGQLILRALAAMTLEGTISASAATGGMGGEIDIASSSDIVIGDSGTTVSPGILFLNVEELDNLSADSLLIGGYRQTTTAGVTVTAVTSTLTLSNTQTSLTGADIILVSGGNLTLADHSSIVQTRTASSVEALELVGSSSSVTSSGTLLRISSSVSGSVSRNAISSSSTPILSVGNGVAISGASVTLDSTGISKFGSSLTISATAISINTATISMVLDGATGTPGANDLIIDNNVLRNFSTAQYLYLVGYNGINFYGSGTIGGIDMLNSLTLQTPSIGGDGGNVVVAAKNITINNPNGLTSSASTNSSSGTLTFDASTIYIGSSSVQPTSTNDNISALEQSHTVNIGGYSTVHLNAANGLLVQGTGSVSVSGALSITAPELTGSAGANQTIASAGTIQVTQSTTSSTVSISGGLSAALTLSGTSVTLDSAIVLDSGILNVIASNGNISVGGTLNVSGTSKTYNDTVEYTDGGTISLISNTGNVLVTQTGKINVSAQSAGGDAGTLTISAIHGSFTNAGTLLGTAGSSGDGGSIYLDVLNLASTSTLDAALNSGGFNALRSYRVRDGDVSVNGVAMAHTYNLSADGGSITVTGLINAAGATVTYSGNTYTTSYTTGGAINLVANGSVTLGSGAYLSVAGTDFNSAGEGGSVSLEAGSEKNGVIGTNRDGSAAYVTIGSGSVVDLSVAANTSTSSSDGDFTGTLHIRAPQYTTSGGYVDVQINTISGAISNASAIIAEGYKIYTPAYGLIDLVTAQVKTDSTLFGASATTISNRLAGSNTTLSSALVVTPGAEIINNSSTSTVSMIVMTATNSAITVSSGGVLIFPEGSVNDKVKFSKAGIVVYADGTKATFTANSTLTLTSSCTVTLTTGGIVTLSTGTYSLPIALTSDTTYTTTSTKSIVTINAGSLVLANDWNLSTYRFGTMSASGVLTLRSAGDLDFLGSLSDGFSSSTYTATLLTQNSSLPTNDQSWSYRLVAGSDFSATDYHQVNSGTGSLRLGISNGINASVTGASLASVIAGHYQVIRTGTGDIDIAVGDDLLLLNQFTSIYTAGVRVTDTTLGGTFTVPQAYASASNKVTKYYVAQYSMAGGDVNISADGDMRHMTLVTDSDGNYVWVDDVESELPMNWLYRRGYVSGGVFATSPWGDVSSTTWWIDFSNFFQGIGALGGGNITLIAGGDISNIDAVIPTNARMKGKDATTGNAIAPSASNLVELGGGDLTVKAGNNIIGGVYYVEKGEGALIAGNQITTNSASAPALPTYISSSSFVDNYSSLTWLPTLLFVGDSGFDVEARYDVLIGPALNPFLLTSGVSNGYGYKSYFSTYSDDSYVHASSLLGDVTLREEATALNSITSTSILSMWLNYLNDLSVYRTWLAWSESDITSFAVASQLSAPTLNITAFNGDVNLQGSVVLYPSSTGTVNLLASGSINGLQQSGTSSLSTGLWSMYDYSTILLSDANPGNLPSITSPYAYEEYANGMTNRLSQTASDFLYYKIDVYFNESGSYTGTNSLLATQNELHDTNILHANDTTGSVHLIAEDGNISGLTLYSAKSAEVIAGTDITDVGLYIQNVSASDVSIVAAGRDIIAYDASSPLRTIVTESGNSYNSEANVMTGDIQISGPGTLEVLAGRNLNLGSGSSNSDGTGVGITSIGNLRNSALPSEGADILIAAGIGNATSLSDSALNFGTITLNSSGNYVVTDTTSFIAQFLCPTTGGETATAYLKDLATLLGLSEDSSTTLIWNTYAVLPEEKQRQLALDIFYMTLRDAGRDHNDATSSYYGTYDLGYKAITALWSSVSGNTSKSGNVTLTSREIKTVSGGDIALFIPTGSLSVGINATGTQALEQGILTQDGGSIYIYTKGDVSLGTSRIFTLYGGDIIIWSTDGDIAAGASSKTVKAAAPTTFKLDTQSANVEVDLAALATGGGIGVLDAVPGATAGDVDLVAPTGTIDAGEAGIRSTGNVSLAAQVILNASNIQAAGNVSGAPVASTPATPSMAAIANSNTATAAASSDTSEIARKNQSSAAASQEMPSIIMVDVIGYGGSDTSEDDSDATSTNSSDAILPSTKRAN
jgi:filamentous hemagglutinin